MVSLPVAQHQRRHKHRQKPIPMTNFRNPIRHQSRPNRHQTIPSPRKLRTTPPKGEPAEAAAYHPADGDAGADAPEDVDQEPAAQVGQGGPSVRSCGGKADDQREVHKRKCEPVIEAGFRGQRKTHFVFLSGAGFSDLYFCGQNRVRWRQRRAEQHRHRDGKAETIEPEKGDGEDRDRHGNAEQPPGCRPGSQADLPVDLQAGAHQRDDHDGLAEFLHDGVVSARIGIKPQPPESKQTEAQ